MSLSLQGLWTGGLLLVPLAAVVLIACRALPLRPASRHLLWASVLLVPVLAPLAPRLPERVAPGITARPDAGLAADADAVAVIPSPAAPTPRPSEESAAVAHHVPRSIGSPAAPAAGTAAHSRSAAAPPAARRPGERGAATGEGRGGRALANAEASIPGDASQALASSPRHSIPSQPVPRAEPLPPSGPPAETAWRQWIHAAGDVREAVAALPPLPATVWLGGAALVLLATAARTWHLRRVIRAGRPAPFDVAAVVLEEAARLGLRRAPETLMVDRRVSPMVWCGRRPRLVLPAGLWAQLDDTGQRAVILHELAHLRRADHWLCRGQLLVGAVYWWHPVVWWIRRRLAEEADHCCDAWVIALRPRARRAYAQALLDTRRYIDRPGGAWALEPAVGLGVTETRTTRFARRLKMVMTEQKTPRLSLRGAALAVLLVVAGCLAAPVLACPPEKDACRKAPAAPPAPPAARLPAAPPAPPVLHFRRPAKPAPAPEPETSYERYLRDRDGARPIAGGDGHVVPERLHEIEERLERLYERLGQTLEEHGATMDDLDLGQWQDALRSFQETLREGELGDARALYRSAIAAMHGDDDHGHGEDHAHDDGGRIVRKYELPEGKLEKLTAIMVRDDVPILVRPLDDGIEVHGTAAEHRVFAAFVKMIRRDERTEMYALPAGKAEAVNALMIRSDVPIIVEPRDDGIRVRGHDLEQEVFAAFVNLIHPRGEHGEMARALGELAERYEERAKDRDDRIDGRRSQLMRQRGNLMERAAEMERRAEETEGRAESLRSEAEVLEDAAESLSGETRQRILREAQGLARQAANLEREAARLEAEAGRLEAEAERLEAEADKLEDESDGR